MKRFRGLLFGATVVCCLDGLGAPVRASVLPVDKRPNIIFLFADDMGWGDLKCYGGPVNTPNLDRLASEGTLFTQFYVAGSVCSPSRVGIMTGRYPARDRVFGHFANHKDNEKRNMPDALDPNVFTLADMLKKAGYVTGHFGKWHLGDASVSPSEYGVDVFRTGLACNMPGQPKADIWAPSARPTCTKNILKDTLEFIQSVHDKPFYVNVWFTDVHATLNPSKEQLERTRQFHAKGVEFFGVDQIYYAALLELDRQIGLFLDKLDEIGLRDSTLIIFSSDNGPEDFQITNAAHSGVGRNGPFRGRKRSIYEGGIRVPFILRWPGHVPSGKMNFTSVVNGVDFLPTLCRIAGGQIDSSLMLDGEDMSDVWLGNQRLRKRSCFWEWRYAVFGHPLNKPPRLAVRDGDYKLLMNPDRSRIELYNIEEDPSELQNLADTKPDVTAKLSKELLEWNGTLPESPVESVAGKKTGYHSLLPHAKQ